jgi:hypothetical protein
MRCSRSRKMCAHGRCLRRSPTSAYRSLNDVRSSLVEARPTRRPPEFRVRIRIRGQGISQSGRGISNMASGRISK